MQLVAQGLLDEVQQLLAFLILLVGGGLFLLGLGQGVVVVDRLELLAVLLAQDLQQQLVLAVLDAQDLVALGQNTLALGQLACLNGILGGSVINILLTLRHALHIGLQRGQLALVGGGKHQQIPQVFFICTVAGHSGILEQQAELPPEAGIVLRTILLDLHQLGLDLLFQIVADNLQLTGVLEHFTRDIQAHILGIHHAGNKAEPLGQQLGTLVHDEHAAGIELQAALIFPGIQVIGRMSGNEQQGLVGNGALHVGADMAQGSLHVTELTLIELGSRLPGDFTLLALPQGHHGVEGFDLGIGLPAALPVLTGIFGLFDLAGLFHRHLDGETHIIGVLLHQTLDGVLTQELIVVLALGVVLDVQDDLGTHRGLGDLGNGIAVGTGRFPLPGLLTAISLGGDGDLVSHHKGRIEAHAELTDHVNIALVALGLGQFLLELQRAALGDGAQIGFQLLAGHADAVILDGEGTGFLVGSQPDGEVRAAQSHLFIGEGQIGQLVDGIAGVGDQFPEKNLFVGVDGVDHHVQQTFGFCFELLFCHGCFRFLYIY